MIKPYGRHLVVRRDSMEVPHDYPTPSRIILPETAKAKSRWGTVISVGSLVDELLPGNRVAITWYSGTPVDHDGEQVELFSKDEILAVEL